MARRRRGDRGRLVGPVVDYPGTPGGPRTDGGARHEGSVILDTATPADPGGLRDAQPPGGGRA